MKKIIKSIVCAILSIVMVLSCTSVAFAKNDVTPVIVVHGMGAMPLYENPGKENQKEISTFDIGSLFTTNNKALHTVLDAMHGKNVDPNTFLDQAKGLLSGFDKQICDENGNSLYDVGIISNWSDSMANHQDYLDSRDSAEPAITKQICDQIGAENVYAFNYDWRLDACENGEKLNKFIDNVKAQTGKSKVTLIGGSEGTVVISAYVDAHKTENELEKVIYLYGALNGVSVANILCKDLAFNKDDLCKYLAYLTTTYNNKSFDFNRLTWLATSMEETINNLCKLINKILADPALCVKFYNELLRPCFGTIPAFWEFLPYDNFDKAVNEMSSIGFLDKNSGLYTKISNYHKVQGRLKSNTEYLKDNGVDIAIVAGWGCPAIGITSQWKNQSDILIDTKYTSLGATTAEFGATLPSSKTKHNSYASLDETIDASTCWFKDNTWFIYGVQHMDFWYGSDACKFVATIVTSTVPTNIKSIKKLTGNGQFIKVDKNQAITKLTGNNSVKTAIKSVKAGKKKATVNWKKKGKIDGYQIQYSTFQDFSKGNKSVTVTKAKTTKKAIKKLKNKKTYYIRIRTYKTVANQKVYSDWSNAKQVKTK